MIIGLTIPSYERFEVGDARVVAAQGCAPGIREVLEKERLYDYAARQPDAIPLVGRAPVLRGEPSRRLRQSGGAPQQ